ncbi:MAG: hypothetical protein RMJ03_01945 [Nitrososphaerota archaeon]|nr:hypothetical protein [Nitrososphaerota archaeon]
MSSIKCGETSYLLEREKTNSLTCSQCGEVFPKPILATVSANGPPKTYYACPRCLTKVKEAAYPKTKEESSKSFVETHKSEKNQEIEGKCPHFFGFLKKRHKNMPIPDECLTCNRMIECLT